MGGFNETQNVILPASSIWRLLDAPPLLPLIWPKSPFAMLLLGLPNHGVLVMPNPSARSSRLAFSVKTKCRIRDASQPNNPGPTNALRLVFPNAAVVGWLKTDVSNHVFVLPIPFSFRKAPLMFASCVLLGAFRLLLLAVMLNGEPDSIESTPLVCHPPMIQLEMPEFIHFLPLPNGSS